MGSVRPYDEGEVILLLEVGKSKTSRLEFSSRLQESPYTPNPTPKP